MLTRLSTVAILTILCIRVNLLVIACILLIIIGLSVKLDLFFYLMIVCRRWFSKIRTTLTLLMQFHILSINLLCSIGFCTCINRSLCFFDQIIILAIRRTVLILLTLNTLLSLCIFFVFYIFLTRTVPTMPIHCIYIELPFSSMFI